MCTDAHRTSTVSFVSIQFPIFLSPAFEPTILTTVVDFFAHFIPVCVCVMLSIWSIIDIFCRTDMHRLPERIVCRPRQNGNFQYTAKRWKIIWSFFVENVLLCLKIASFAYILGTRQRLVWHKCIDINHRRPPGRSAFKVCFNSIKKRPNY